MKKILILSVMISVAFPFCSTNKKDNRENTAKTVEQAPDSTINQIDARGYIVQVGDEAPNFTIKYIDGKTAQLNDLRGKTLMLQFTASWCSVCRKEMPFIESDIWQKHKDNENFALIGIDLKEDAKTIETFRESTGVTYPVVLDEDGKIFELYAEKEAGVTRNVLINKEGKIVFLTRLYDETEFENLKQHIEKLLE
jgi:peroxiredoxin